MNRTIRLFVSSTFSDMKAERDILQDKVFPRLQHHCLAKGLRFQAIDLRWGVPEEAGKDNRTMRICQRELNRCQEGEIKPNFLVLLGDRYGWRPLPEALPAEVFEGIQKILAQRRGGAELLETWYRRDDNAVPPEYVLQPRTGRFEEFAVWQSDVELPLLATLIESAEALLSSSALSAPLREQLLSTGIGLSATHQEILHGAFDLAPDEVRRHVHTFSRTITGASPPPHRDFADFLPDGSPDTRSRDRLERLKSGLKEHLGGETNFHEYSLAWNGDGEFPAADLEPFASSVFDCIKQVIDAQVADLNEVSREAQEEQAHHAFCEERRNGFVGRDEPLAAIESYLRAGSSHPLAIIGPAGSGKSALLAEAVHQARGNSHSEIISRFIGVTPGSSDLIELLRDLVACIRARYPREVGQGGTGVPPVAAEPSREPREKVPDDREIPNEINPLTMAFHEALGRATAERPLWIFLDALDQFRDANLAASLSWLPQKLPDHVRIVVSAAEPSTAGAVNPLESSRLVAPAVLSDPRATIIRNLVRIAPGGQTLRLEPLTPADGEALLKQWLDAAGRTLDETQRRPILDAFAVEGNALWLRVAAEEAARWPRWHTPDPPPPGLHDLLATVLERLSRNEEHGALFVKRALGYLACARHGLAEDEIIGVLGADPTVMADIIARSTTERVKAEAERIKALPVAIWVRFHGDIAFYLTERRNQGAALFGFYHSSFGEAVERFCLKTDADRLPLHQTMARWFGAQPWFLPPAGEGGQPPSAPERSDPANTRKASELPFHLQRVAELAPDADRWGPLVDVLCDLDCVETKARSGLIYELVGDYNAALSELPEFRKENERLAKHDAAMIAYNKALRDYAVVRCDWWFAKERGERRPEPPYPALPDELRDEAQHAIPEESFPRAARLRQFSTFVSGHITLLTEYHEDTLPIAYNWAADGPVAKSAERQIDNRKLPWLKRSPRPPAPPIRPVCLRTLEGHEKSVDCVSVSPDGRRAVSGSYDNTVRVWDLETGACLCTLEGHSSRVLSVIVSPDGRRAVSGSDSTVRVWDLETGACLRTLEGHSNAVGGVSVSSEWRYAVSGSFDKTILVWDLETGACLHTFKGHSHVMCVSFSSDGRRVVSGSEDNTVRVWDLETGACLRTLEGHSSGVLSVDMSSDGRRIVTGSQDHSVRVWDVETGACLRTLNGHGANPVNSVSVGPDCRRAISAGWDMTLCLWDIESGQCLRTFNGHKSSINSVCVCPNGRHAVSASGDDLGRVCKDNTVRVWDLERECLPVTEGHLDWINSISVCTDKRCAVSASKDSTLRIWDIDQGVSLRTFGSTGGNVMSASVCPDGHRLAVASLGGDVQILDVESGASLRRLEGPRRSNGWANCVSVRPDGLCAVTGPYSRTLWLWELESGKCLRALEGHRSTVTNVSISPNGRHAVSSGEFGGLLLWDLESGYCLRHFAGHSKWEDITSVIISPDGRHAVSASGDKTIRLWNLRDGECLKILEGHTDKVWSIIMSSDGHRVASASEDTTLRIWDMDTGCCVAVYPAGISMRSIAITPAGDRIICGTADGQMHFLTPVNFPPSGPPILTAVRLWIFDDNGSAGHWDDRITACCPWCGWRFPVRDDMLGQQIACPLDACGKLLQLNPFAVDGREGVVENLKY